MLAKKSFNDYDALTNVTNFSAISPNCLTHTFVLLDGEHGQSIDDFIGGQRSTQSTAEYILEKEKKYAEQRVKQE